MRATLLPPPKSLFRQAKLLRAPTSLPFGAIPPILGYWGWQVTVASGPPVVPKAVSTAGMQQKGGCLPEGTPRRSSAHLAPAVPSRQERRTRGFASPPLCLPHPPQPLLIYLLFMEHVMTP